MTSGTLPRAGAPPELLDRRTRGRLGKQEKGVRAIERHLRETFPELRPCQFLSVRTMANDALKVNLNRDILKVTPRKIYLSVLAMNGAYCLGLDQLFGGATAFADPYRKLDNLAMARRLHDHWSMSSPRCSVSVGGMAGFRTECEVGRRGSGPDAGAPLTFKT